MLFAAIDVGTNSIHLVVVEPDGVVVVTAQADGDASGELEAAMEKADLLGADGEATPA